MSFAFRPHGGFYPVDPIPLAASYAPDSNSGDASVLVEFYSTGGFLAQTEEGGGFQPSTGSWHVPQTTGVGSTYWIRLTVTSGTAPGSGTVGSWLRLNATRSWSWRQSVIGSQSATIKFEISTDSGGATIVSSKSGIALTVTKSA